MKTRQLKEHVESRLDAHGRTRLFSQLGFHINGHKPNSSGFVSGIKGPKVLGEGKNGNFSLNPSTGAVKDHGGTGYKGDLWNCIQDVRGCEFREALEWAAKELSIQIPTSREWDPFGDEARQTAHYDYVEEKGNRLFQVIKFELVDEDHPAYPDKTFRQRKWNVETRNWSWSTKGVRKPLYRLPRVLKAIERGETIHVVEGEKDVAALERIGLTATCNPQGAGKWRDEHSETLEGADVAIYPDNDKPGHDHANQVGSSLHGKAKSVKIVELPRLGKKGDAHDWVEAGGTATELKELVEAAEPYTPPKEPPTGIKHNSVTIRGGKYAARNGQLLEIKNDGDTAKVIADFEAYITEEITTEKGERIYKIEARTRAGRPFTLDIEAEKFEEDRSLKAKIGAAAGAKSPVRTGMTRHLSAALKMLSKDVDERRRFDRTGWTDGGFLIHGRETDDVEINLPRELPYATPENANLAKGREALDAAIKSLGPEHTTPLVSFALIGPLARSIKYLKRHAFFIRGRTGSLKTSFAQVLMCLWGEDFLKDEKLLKWGEGMTHNAAIALAAKAHDLPIPFDNYKPSTGRGDKDFINFIHMAVEGGEKARLNRNSELKERKELRCWPLCTGEDLPNTDAASLARLLTVEFAWQKGRANPDLTKAQELSGHLPAIGRAWIDWLESEEGKQTAERANEDFPQLRTKWADYLRKKRPDMVNILRVASNLASNALTYKTAMECPAFGDVLQAHHDSYKRGILNTADEMGEYTTESLEAQRLLSGLKSLLAAGRISFPHRLEASSRDEDEKRVGWQDDQGYYLILDAAIEVVQDLYKRSGGLGGVTKQTLCSQFDGLDLVASRSKSRTTKAVRVAGGSRHRVLHLKGEALDEIDKPEEE